MEPPPAVVAPLRWLSAAAMCAGAWGQAQPDAAPDCTSPGSSPGPEALRFFQHCGFVTLNQAVDPAAVRQFDVDLNAYVEHNSSRFSDLTTAPQPGEVIFERAIVQLPVDDVRFAEKMVPLLAPPALVAIMDSYFGAEVELDAVTVIRNHGCKHGSCSFAEQVKVEPERQFNYLNEPKDYHHPCCGGKDQGFHRDLDWPGSITVNIPLRPQRPGFGLLRFCIDKATGQGHHVGPRPGANEHRKYDARLAPLYESNGYTERKDEYNAAYENQLLPKCQDPETGVRVSPEAEVGDITMYESTMTHEGTTNTRRETRDIIAITFTWRGCPVSQGDFEEKEWECGECFHCEGKSGWAASHFGLDGPGGQREKIAQNYHKRREHSNLVMAQVRAGSQYKNIMRSLKTGGKDDNSAPSNRLYFGLVLIGAVLYFGQRGSTLGSTCNDVVEKVSQNERSKLH